jgi:hypothetical protein
LKTAVYESEIDNLCNLASRENPFWNEELETLAFYGADMKNDALHQYGYRPIFPLCHIWCKNTTFAPKKYAFELHHQVHHRPMEDYHSHDGVLVQHLPHFYLQSNHQSLYPDKAIS